MIHSWILKYPKPVIQLKSNMLEIGAYMHKIHVKDDMASAAALGVSSAGKLIRAKDFLDCFRQKPNDLYLMHKFSLSRKQLAKAYQALIEKGWLTELEYHYLRGIPPVVSEGRIGAPSLGEVATKNRNSETRGMERQCDEIREPLVNLRESVWSFADKVFRQRSDGADKQRRNRLPVDKSARFGPP
jgi:hypothetical protein